MDLIEYITGKAPLVMRMRALLSQGMANQKIFIHYGRRLLTESESAGSSDLEIHKILEKAVLSREHILETRKE